MTNDLRNAQDKTPLISTHGGSVISGDVNITNGDFIGRDQINITEDTSYDVRGLESPYLGLHAFTYDERGRYAGREIEVANALFTLIEPGKQATLYFITGTSGSGKSSFAQAGLLPALEEHYTKRNQTLRLLPIIHPGDNPKLRIADALSLIGAQDIDRLNRAQAEPAVLVLDQFEEFFTQSPPDQRTQVFAQLAALPLFAQSHLHIIATLRSDYLRELYDHKELWQISKQGTELRAMSEDALKQAIQRPLQSRAEVDGRYTGKRFEPGLVNLLAKQTSPDPALLPLLQVTLDELWRKTGLLKLSSYGADGHLTNALKHRADAVLSFRDFDMPVPKQQRSKEEQTEMLATLLDLVKVSLDDDVRHDVRATRPMNTLSTSRQKLAQELASARLVSINNDSVSVIHESLINNWGKLRDTVSEQREILQQRVRFEQDLADWLANGKKESYLVKGLALARAKELERINDVALNAADAQDLLQASQNLVEVQQKRTQRKSRIVIAGLSILTVLALAMSGVAFVSRNEADQRARIARSQVLGSQGLKLAQTKTTTSNLLGVEANKQINTAFAQDSLSKSVLNSSLYENTFKHGGQVNGVLWNRDETLLLTWSNDNTTRVWDAKTGRQFLSLRHENTVNGALWNRDETLLLTWSDDNTVRVWDAKTGRQFLFLQHGSAVSGALWNKDETLLLTWSFNHTVRVWDAKTGHQFLSLHQSEINGVRWNRDETLLLTWSFDNTARVWDAKTGRQLLSLQHGFWVDGALWNKDETLLLTWSFDNTARVWDAKTGRQLFSLQHEGWVDGARWNRDETLLLTSSNDNTARVWDAKTGRQLLSLQHDSSVQGALWNKDGTLLLTWSNDNTARVWDAKTGRQLFSLQHEGWVDGALWNKDETLLLTWSFDNTVRVWDAKTGHQLLSLQNEGRINGAGWNKDETLLLTWSNDNTARIRDAKIGRQLLSLQHDASIQGALWNKDETLLLTWSFDKTARVWDAKTGRQLFSLQHEGWVDGALWNKDETLLLTWSFDNTARVWDAKTGRQLFSLQHEGWVDGARWNRDETLLLTSSNDNTARVWDAKTGRQLLSLQHDSSVQGALWNKDGTLLLTWSNDNTARVWDAKTGRQLLSLQHDSSVQGTLWNKDETLLLTWSNDNTARVWDAKTGRQLLSLQHDSSVQGALWNKDETLLLTWSYDTTTRVWDAKTGHQLLSLQHDSSVQGALWNKDETLLLTWSYDTTTRVWDAKTGHQLLSLQHDSSVQGALWNKDETLLLTWSYDTTTRVWDTKTGELLEKLEGDSSSIASAGFSIDQKRVWFVTKYGMLGESHVDIDDLAHEACQRVYRNFTWQEWQTYFPGEKYRITCPNLPAHESVPADQIS